MRTRQGSNHCSARCDGSCDDRVDDHRSARVGEVVVEMASRSARRSQEPGARSNEVMGTALTAAAQGLATAREVARRQVQRPDGCEKAAVL